MTTDRDPQGNSRLNRLFQYTLTVEDGLLVIMLSTMIVVASVQILLRNVWGTGLGWADPLLRILVLWVALLGAMVATRENNHITIDILSRYLPRRGKQLSQLITNLFTSIVCGILAFHSARFVIQDYAAEVSAFYAIPAWLFELIIPIGFAVICLRFALHFIAVLRGQLA
ncbi:MAG: C4-dicarboxylate TRAP transporter small permease protein DctQ [Gammaproteobacteria bacterium]|nr:MAG: C4-dicarboxylate TRAP transporter small permease protein DctQ [Gammaproteobacteria bacterium]